VKILHEEKTQKLIDMHKKIRNKQLRNLVRLLYVINNLYGTTGNMFECTNGYPNSKVVQSFLKISKRNADDLINTMRAIDLSHDIGAILLISEENKRKIIEALKQELQKED